MLSKISSKQHIFLILDIYHPDTLYLCEQGCENPWLMSTQKGVGDQKSLGNTALDSTGRAHDSESQGT